MPKSTPNPQGEERKSRLDLLKERVGKGEETPEVPKPQAETVTPVSKPVVQEVQQPSLPYPMVGLGQPSTHDRRSKVPFDQRYKKDNFMLDVRLVPYIYHWLETHGMSKTDAVNRAWLKVLLADGYEIDPHLLDKPFTSEDLPK